MTCAIEQAGKYTPAPCDTATHVVLSRVEWHTNPFNLTPESGAAIGGAVLVVMAVAFVFRMIRKALESQ